MKKAAKEHGIDLDNPLIQKELAKIQSGKTEEDEPPQYRIN